MKPLNSEILITYEEPTEKKTEGGLYVPPETNKMGGTANNFLKQGKVIAVNPDCKNIAVDDEILFDNRAKVKVPGMSGHYLVRTEDVYLVL